MGTGELGKWAWIIGLALLVLGGLLGAFMDNPITGVIADIALALAFLGGIFHLAGGDRTAFFIAALALGAFAGGAGMLFVDVLGSLVSGILGGAAAAAGAGAAGVLLMTVYEWIMP
jgi:hypothetical protein